MCGWMAGWMDDYGAADVLAVVVDEVLDLLAVLEGLDALARAALVQLELDVARRSEAEQTL